MEVILENCKEHPRCPHGPCLMFERHSANGAKTGKRFYACSACRDRSVCSFFHWVDDNLPSQKKDHWKRIIKESGPKFSHEECVKRLTSIQKLSPSQRKYCKTCSLLILPHENKHQKHEVVDNMTSEHLLQPSLLFQTFENKKAEAQYFFSDKSKDFLISLLRKRHYSKFILIGVPKIHEHLVTLRNEDPKLMSLLMDIDPRYMQFFSPDQFCHYNLFNNHFFGGKSAKKGFKQYLSEKGDEKVVILLDPPFGGLIDAISYTLQKINKWWQTVNDKSSTENLPVLWFFPYFLEPRIVKNMPDLEMMDYKVEYMNHKKFGLKAGSKGSPVRIFTNVNKTTFALPESEGYRFCNDCKRYVSKENQHCSKCNACTTKHGKTYKHCDSCQQCVKNSYVHCEVHKKCVPELSESTKTICKCGRNSADENVISKCYRCFGYGHRKRDCSVNMRQKKEQRKK